MHAGLESGALQIDTYTKTILTIIAAALVWLCMVLTPARTPRWSGTPLSDLERAWQTFLTR